MSKASITHQVLTDDDGSGTTGTVLNNALFDTIQDNIDTALAQVIQTKVATYTLDALDDLVIFTTAGASLNLPAANSVGNKPFSVVNAAATGLVTIDPNGAELIDGAASITLQPGEGALIQSTGSAWRRIATKPGVWIAVTFNAADYTAATGLWTVASGDNAASSYMIVGNEMTMSFQLNTTTVTATPTELRIAIPLGKTIAQSTQGVLWYFEGVAWTAGYISASTGQTYIRIMKNPGGAAWATTTDGTYVHGQITFPIS